MHNFAAGPAMMHPRVKQRLVQMLLDWQGCGMGITEVPHRSEMFRTFLRHVQEKVLKTMGLTQDFEVLLFSGTTRSHFSLIAQQFLKQGAEYAVTGHWSAWAAQAAQRYGTVQICSRWQDCETRPGVDFAYACLNETIDGIQCRALPDVGLPWVVDATSEIFSRPIDFQNINLMLAGAQKNAGIAGLTIVIVRKIWLNQARLIDPVFSYVRQSQAENLFATPPAFAIAALDATLDWIAENGGVRAMHERAQKRSALVYDEIDHSHGFYRNAVSTDCRSLMNIPFHLPTQALTERFLCQAEVNGLLNLKGHTSVGGIRASMYNAMPQQAAEDLVRFMKNFRLQQDNHE